MNFWVKNYVNLELTDKKEFRPFLFRMWRIYQKKTKLTRTKYSTLTYTKMKYTLRKVFSDNLSAEYKTVHAYKEELEIVNFNRFRRSRKQKTYRRNTTISIERQGKIMRGLKCNSTEHFARDCFSFRNINTVVDSDQVHFSLFSVNSRYQTLIKDSNIKMFNLVKETRNKAVFDSACSLTAAREISFNVFYDKW